MVVQPPDHSTPGGERMTQMSRRSFLRTASAGVATGLFALGTGRAVAQPELPWSAIGFSQVGEPLIVHHLGDGPNRVLILGGQHGGPEANTIRLVRQLVAHFADRPDEVPAGLGLDLLPVANPDGA